MPTVRDALLRAATALGGISASPRIDAELLMAHALGVERDTLILRHLEDDQPEAFDPFLSRRLEHEPVAYIAGTRDFWTITLNVSPDVLIPRPDSETLIEAAIAHFGGSAPQHILDLGTGSGALLLAALSHWPDAHGLGIDASEGALGIAARNASTLKLGARADFKLGNWAEETEGPFDLILCNPPYVESEALLAPEVADYEPHKALFAGPEGLDDYRHLAPQIARLIAPGGIAVVEIGHQQAAATSAIFGTLGLNVTVRQDLGGRDRCLVLTTSS
jgi:release factor glutamine methyltransferase